MNLKLKPRVGAAIATSFVFALLVTTGSLEAQEGASRQDPLNLEDPVAETSSADDARLRELLHERFLNDARVRSYRINIEAVGGKITLRGAVKTLDERAAAMELATAVPGIQRLVNEITVVPDNRSANAIQNDVLGRLRSAPSLSGSTIQADVESQTVIIGGTFPTLATMDQAVEIVATVAGVSDIRLEAEVVPTMPLSDEGLREAVSKALVDDGRVRARDIRVGVRDGRVILEGSAPSLYQIKQADWVARKITGVRAVENRLKLRSEGGRVG